MDESLLLAEMDLSTSEDSDEEEQVQQANKEDEDKLLYDSDDSMVGKNAEVANHSLTFKSMRTLNFYGSNVVAPTPTNANNWKDERPNFIFNSNQYQFPPTIHLRDDSSEDIAHAAGTSTSHPFFPTGIIINVKDEKVNNKHPATSAVAAAPRKSGAAVLEKRLISRQQRARTASMGSPHSTFPSASVGTSETTSDNDDDDDDDMDDSINVTLMSNNPSAMEQPPAAVLLMPPPTGVYPPRRQSSNNRFQRLGGINRNSSAGRGQRSFHTRKQNEAHNQKLVEGVQAAIGGDPSTESSEVEHEMIRKIRSVAPDPWATLMQLAENGYKIFWQLFKISKAHAGNNDLKGRAYKCVVKLEEIIGVCEASTKQTAQAGAAVNFFQKFKMQARLPLPTGIILPTELDKVSRMMIDTRQAVDLMIEKYRAKYNKHLHFRFEVVHEQICGKTLHITNFWVDRKKFEGYYINSVAKSKAAAVLAAYEATLEEPFPFDPVYIGEEEISKGDFYFKLESHKTLNFDFSLAPSISSKTASTNSNMGRGRARASLGSYLSYTEPK